MVVVVVAVVVVAVVVVVVVVVVVAVVQGRRQGFRPGWAKFGTKRRNFFFCLPTLVFSLPTLPYVTVAQPAHRTEADLREKASLATNQEGPLPSV